MLGQDPLEKLVELSVSLEIRRAVQRPTAASSNHNTRRSDLYVFRPPRLSTTNAWPRDWPLDCSAFIIPAFVGSPNAR